MATQILLYHTSSSGLSTSYGSSTSDDTNNNAYGAGRYVSVQHAVYRRNGTTDTLIASGLAAATNIGVITGSWTPSSDVAYGSGDYLKVKVSIEGANNIVHQHYFTDGTAQRGTLKAVATALSTSCSEVYLYYDEDWGENVYGYFHNYGGGLGYIQPTFEAPAGGGSVYIPRIIIV